MNKLVLSGNPLCAPVTMFSYSVLYIVRDGPTILAWVFVQMHFFAVYEDTLLLLELSSLHRRNDIGGW